MTERGKENTDVPFRGYLGLGIIISVGFFMAILEIKHIVEMSSTVGITVFATVPFLFNIGLIGAGYVLWNSSLEDNEILWVAGWTMFGIILIGLLALWIITHQHIRGQPFHHSTLVTVNNMSAGGLIGFLVGWYHVHNRHHKKEVLDEQARLQSQQQHLEVLHRILRHNIRNEVNMIAGYAKMLNDKSGNRRGSPECIIEERANRLKELTEKTRHMLTTHNRESDVTTVDIANVCSRSISQVRDDDMEADIRSDIPDSAWGYAISEDLLEIAITNLIENAVKHNDAEEPQVMVSVSVSKINQEEIIVRIVDNGPGIPEMERKVLFKGHETSLSHGSGVGLWLVHWIISETEGDLEFEENTPRGSIVILKIRPATKSA